MKRILVAVGFAALALAPAYAEDDCSQLARIASLEMLPSSGNRVVVPAAVGDNPLRMVVDTGGYFTALKEDKAKELGLEITIVPESGLVMFGGTPLRHVVTLPDFRLGRLKAGRMDYPLLPPGFLGPDVDGSLAPDFLANFDVDFDFAGGTVNLFSRNHCDGKVGYWTNRAPIGIPILRERDGVHISMDVELDGKEVRAMIDTGAPYSVMLLEEAQDLFDIKDNDPKLESLPVGPNGTRGAKHYPFGKITFGGVEVKNPVITLVPESEMRMGPNPPKLILGLSILRQLHLYLAYHEKMLYVTPASEHR
jgi:predicted aspartyl protease